MFHSKIKSLGYLSPLIFTKLTYSDYDSKEYNKYIGQTFTKKEFFNKFPNFSPYKVIKKDMTHHNYKYNLGFNKIDTFITKNECSAGGFYLTDNTNIYSYLDYGENIAIISLPNTSLIYLEDKKIKVSELVIEKIISKHEYFSNLNDKFQLEAVKQRGYSIQYINNPDKKVQLESVKQYGYSIQYINNPDKEVQLEAVKQNEYAIKYINNPDKEVQKKAERKINKQIYND